LEPSVSEILSDAMRAGLSSPRRLRTFSLGAALLVALGGSAWSGGSTGKTYTFSSVRQGVAHGGKWKDDSNAILQADGSGKVAFPLFVFNSPRFSSIDYSGEFLIESGDEDRYAGFVFRLRDARNYYAVRFSASENNVFFARFDNGDRLILHSFDATISSKQWHRIKLVARKNAVTIFLDGHKIGTASDTRWRIGKVGLGTKADSITRFRRLSVKPV